MKKKIVIIAVVIVLIVSVIAISVKKNDGTGSDCHYDEHTHGVYEETPSMGVQEIKRYVKKDQIFTVRVSMDDSGPIKSMALSFDFSDEDFELIDGQWINHKAILADFNIENRDAAIAFVEAENYFGEIFEFRMKAKKDIEVNFDSIRINPILKNNSDNVNCKGVVITVV